MLFRPNIVLGFFLILLLILHFFFIPLLTIMLIKSNISHICLQYTEVKSLIKGPDLITQKIMWIIDILCQLL